MATIIGVLYEEINPLIVGIKYSGTDLSFYSKGKSFPSLLDTTISQTLSSVLFPVMAKVQDDQTMVLTITRRYMKVASFVIFPVMVGFFAVSESFVQVILTEKWLPIVPYIQIFCVSSMFNLVQKGNLEAIKAIGRSDIILILEIIKKSLYFLVIIGFVFWTNHPEMLALSAIICTVIASIVNTYPNRKLIGYKYRYQILDIFPNLILAIVMGAVVYGLGYLPISVYLVFPLQILAGIMVYVLLSAISRNESFFYALRTIKQFAKRI